MSVTITKLRQWWLEAKDGIIKEFVLLTTFFIVEVTMKVQLLNDRSDWFSVCGAEAVAVFFAFWIHPQFMFNISIIVAGVLKKQIHLIDAFAYASSQFIACFVGALAGYALNFEELNSSGSRSWSTKSKSMLFITVNETYVSFCIKQVLFGMILVTAVKCVHKEPTLRNSAFIGIIYFMLQQLLGNILNPAQELAGRVILKAMGHSGVISYKGDYGIGMLICILAPVASGVLFFIGQRISNKLFERRGQMESIQEGERDVKNGQLAGDVEQV